ARVDHIVEVLRIVLHAEAALGAQTRAVRAAQGALVGLDPDGVAHQGPRSTWSSSKRTASSFSSAVSFSGYMNSSSIRTPMSCSTGSKQREHSPSRCVVTVPWT